MMNRNHGLLGAIPNMLTLFRAVLACLLYGSLSIRFGDLLIPVALFLLIFLSDFLDGKIARRYGCASKSGAVLDILADLLYVVLSYIVLCEHKVLPIWFFIVMLLKFMEFIVTSFLLRKYRAEKTLFVFDFIGRHVAVLFYGMPFLAYISFLYWPSLFLFIRNIMTCFVSIIAFASSSYRIWCYYKTYANNISVYSMN